MIASVNNFARELSERARPFMFLASLADLEVFANPLLQRQRVSEPRNIHGESLDKRKGEASTIRLAARGDGELQDGFLLLFLRLLPLPP